MRQMLLLQSWLRMEGTKKSPLCWWQALRYRRPTLVAGLSFFFLVLFLPTHPLEGESGTDQMELAEAQKIHRTFSIYSVLRSSGMGMEDAALWDISEVIIEESEGVSLDPMLVVAMIAVESTFRHDAVSTKGARGLMQIRPFVADALAKEVELEGWEGKKSLEDPIINIKLGVLYLNRLKEKFRDLSLALTAYNWGPHRLRSKLEGEEEIPLGFARKVLSFQRIYKRRSAPTEKTPINRPRRQQARLADPPVLKG